MPIDRRKHGGRERRGTGRFVTLFVSLATMVAVGFGVVGTLHVPVLKFAPEQSKRSSRPLNETKDNDPPWEVTVCPQNHTVQGMLRAALAFPGSHEPKRRLCRVAKALAGVKDAAPMKIVVLGGSMPRGDRVLLGCRTRSSPKRMRVACSIAQETERECVEVVVENLAVGGTTTLSALAHHSQIPSDADLFIIDYDVRSLSHKTSPRGPAQPDPDPLIAPPQQPGE